MSTPEQALERAKKAVGGNNALAAVLGTSPQAVSQWDRVPPGRAIAVECATGVSRHELRPDIFGPAPTAAAAE